MMLSPIEQAALAADTAHTLARAQRLNKAMLKLALEREGLGKISASELTLLREASLIEMAGAAELVKRAEAAEPPNADGSRTISMICDDRLVAAIYAFLNFAVPPAHGVFDDDFLILKMSHHKHGTEYASFLMCGIREITAEDEDKDELEDAA